MMYDVYNKISGATFGLWAAETAEDAISEWLMVASATIPSEAEIDAAMDGGVVAEEVPTRYSDWELETNDGHHVRWLRGGLLIAWSFDDHQYDVLLASTGEHADKDDRKFETFAAAARAVDEMDTFEI